MNDLDIEILDSEDAACALEAVEAQLVRQGQYAAATAVIDAYRRIRADAEALAEAERTIAELRHRMGEREDELGQIIAELREQLRLTDILSRWACKETERANNAEDEGAELEADLEWITDVRPRLRHDDRGWFLVVEVDAVPAQFYDGTAAGLRAAVRRARKGEG